MCRTLHPQLPPDQHQKSLSNSNSLHFSESQRLMSFFSLSVLLLLFSSSASSRPISRWSSPPTEAELPSPTSSLLPCLEFLTPRLASGSPLAGQDDPTSPCSNLVGPT